MICLLLSLTNPVCSLDLQYTSVWIGHFMSQKPHVAISYHIRQHRPRAFCLQLSAATCKLWGLQLLLMFSLLFCKMGIIKLLLHQVDMRIKEILQVKYSSHSLVNSKLSMNISFCYFCCIIKEGQWYSLMCSEEVRHFFLQTEKTYFWSWVDPLITEHGTFTPRIFKMVFIIVRKFGTSLKRSQMPPMGCYALFRLQHIFKIIWV